MRKPTVLLKEPNSVSNYHSAHGGESYDQSKILMSSANLNSLQSKVDNTFGTPSEDKEKNVSAAENQSSDTNHEERPPRANSNASVKELN